MLQVKACPGKEPWFDDLRQTRDTGPTPGKARQSDQIRGSFTYQGILTTAATLADALPLEATAAVYDELLGRSAGESLYHLSGGRLLSLKRSGQLAECYCARACRDAPRQPQRSLTTGARVT